MTFYCLLLAWLHISWTSPKHTNNELVLATSTGNSFNLICSNDESSSLYELLALEQMGLSKPAFEYAYKGYRLLLKKGIVRSQEYLTICDFSQSSNHKRLYLLDMTNKEVLLNTYVAHGRN